MIKKTINHVIAGIGISFIITLIMLNIFIRESSGAQVLDACLIWLIAGGFYGLVSMIHDTQISKAIAVPLHFLSNMAISLIAIELMFRLAFNKKIDFSYWFLIIIFIITYVIISACIHLYEKLDVEKINKKLGKSEEK